MTNVTHLDDNGSYHQPLLVHTNPETRRGNRRFLFQERWCGLEAVNKFVKENWQLRVSGSAMVQLFQKLKRCRHELVKWQSSGAGNSRRAME
ncbi:hypothetical protein AHAS_Ahas19G0265100 [Arachis hypogaea]